MTAPVNALSLIDGVLPWCSESAQSDLRKARAAVVLLVEKATALSVLVDACACWNTHNDELIDALAAFEVKP